MDDFDVVLVNAHFSESDSNRRLCPPLGILYLGSLLLQNRLKVKLLDYNLEPKGPEGIAEDIRGMKSPIFAISSLSFGYAFVKNLVQIIRNISPDSKILLGGAVTWSLPEFILESTGVDIVVEGEAENCFLQVVEAILTDEDYTNIPGVYCMVEGEIRKPKCKQEMIKDLSSLPFPAWELVNIKEYIKRLQHAWHSESMRSFPILASRGCPYSCNFCVKNLGDNFRSRSEGLIEEIELVIERYMIDDIWFIDEEFALSKRRALELCRLIESVSSSITFVCSMRVNCVSSGILQAMKKAGCRRIMYGVESGSSKILKAMNKGFTKDQAAKAIIETRNQGIEAYVNFMFGYPGETESTIWETIDFMKEHRLHSGFGFTTPLPGTRLFEEVMAKGLINDLDEYILGFNPRGWAETIAVNLTDIPTPRLLELRKLAKEETYPDRIVLKE